ncbi:aminotransferase class V-fold PLP-dependent enzyme, partial [Candidatus Micrarchaeota archaeon]|nr:aminotransferase class V-fold PLP-dependent enzyme [Candidatus Micrarchaeota archaeon]
MNIDKIREDFPILSTKVNGKPLVYLDSAATSQKPIQVLQRVREFYTNCNANVHRGVYKISEQATEDYENSRKNIADFIGCKNPAELIFTRNATEGINLVAYAWGEENINQGDKIVISIMEHHSNLVPWQQLAIHKKAKLEFMDIDPSTGEIPEKEFEKIKGAKLVGIVHVSNVLGTTNKVKQICKLA